MPDDEKSASGEERTPLGQLFRRYAQAAPDATVRSVIDLGRRFDEARARHDQTDADDDALGGGIPGEASRP